MHRLEWADHVRFPLPYLIASLPDGAAEDVPVNDATASWFGRHWLWVALVVIGTIHLPSLGHDFVDFDDDTIFLQNETLRRADIGALADIFAWDRPTDYRPVRDVSHWIDHLAHGQDPFWAHFHNWLLLLGVAFVFGQLLRRLEVGGGSA